MFSASHPNDAPPSTAPARQYRRHLRHNLPFLRHLCCPEPRTQAITRLLPDAQFSRVVVHNGVVHLAGQPAKDRSASVKLQTAEILRSLDALLAKAGTDKSRLLSAVIHLADMRHKAEMDEAWITWVDSHNTPARAVVETRLGNLGSGVMIRVTAAL